LAADFEAFKDETKEYEIALEEELQYKDDKILELEAA
jgi:hypothetical protein